MRQAHRGLFLALFSILFLFPFSVSAQVETFDYTVEQGDTCESIAEEFYGHVGGCDLIEKYNPNGGEGPNLTPGNVLALPTKVAKAEAEVDKKHGSVRAREPDRTWHPAAVGEELFRTWRVNTLEAARASLLFRDRSGLEMRQNTLVIIYGGSRERIRRKRSHAELERGTLRSRLADLAGESKGMALDTPSAEAELGPGEALVDVEESGTTRVANHGGEPIAVSGRGKASGKRVTVAEGMGTKVERGRPPTPPKKLPPAPTWRDLPTDAVIFEGETATVAAAWEPVERAEEYFVELTADREGIEVIRSAYVSADVTRLEVEGLPAGKYFATVSSIDGDKFEGIPAKRRTLRVVPVAAPGERVEEAEGQTAETPTFVLGSRLEMPGDVRCGLGDGAKRRSVRLGMPGEHELRCEPEGDAEGRSIRPREIRVEAPGVEVGGPDWVEGRVEVRGGRPARVDVTFEPMAPSEMEVEALGAGVSAGATPVTGSRWRVQLAAEEGVSGESVVALRVGGETLREIPVRVTAEVAQERERRGGGSIDAERAFRLGVTVGGVGRATGGDFGVGGRAEIVVGYAHSRRFALELIPRVGRGGGAWRLGGRLQGLFAFTEGRLQPFVATGIGLDAPFGTPAAPTIEASGGLLWWWDDRWGLRVEAGTGVGFDGGSVLWRPAIGIGPGVRFR